MVQRLLGKATGLFQKSTHLIGPLFKYILAPVAVLVLAGYLLSTPSVTGATAYTFFGNYYSQVTQASQRQRLYQHELTSSFRSYPVNAWRSYTAFWQTEKSVTVDSVIPVPGNSLEFTVSLTFHPRRGNAFEDAYDFWLVCNGLPASLLGRVPGLGCPLHDLEIDNGQLAPMSH